MYYYMIYACIALFIFVSGQKDLCIYSPLLTTLLILVLHSLLALITCVISPNLPITISVMKFSNRHICYIQYLDLAQHVKI